MTAFGTDKFGCRPLVMFGGFALFLGYLLSSLATGIGVVMLAQGVIGGNANIYLKMIFFMREVEVRPFDNIILKDKTFINGNTCMLIIISLSHFTVNNP